MNNLAQVITSFEQEAMDLSGRLANNWTTIDALEKTNWLQGFRNDARRRLTELKLPTSKTEDWKYIQLKQLLESDYLSSAGVTEEYSRQALSESASELSQCLIENLDAYRLVFINGEFVKELSEHHDCPHSIMFSEANAAQRSLILEHLDTTRSHFNDYFSSLNSTLINNGLLIHIPKNTVVDKPFYVVNLRVGLKPRISMMRILIIAEAGSDASLIEHEDAADKHNVMQSSVIESFVNENARFTHSRLQLDENATSISSQRISQGINSVYQQHQISFASMLKRNDLTVTLQGQNANADIRGCFYGRHQQVIDNHTSTEHIATHCTSQEMFRGLIDDRAKAIFNGRIHIHPNAQKTSAELSNKNLLLSNEAEIYTKPELEIYADDVKCSHGATVGQIDSEALFYLQSRGISEADAKLMLSLAFIAEVVEQLPEASVKDFMNQRLSTLFSDQQYKEGV